MVVVQFYPLDVHVRLMNQHSAVLLYGRTLSGEPICVLDQSYQPYFYVVPKTHDTGPLEADLHRFTVKSKDEYYSIVRVEKKLMKLHEKETEVMKVYLNNHFACLPLYHELSKNQHIKAIYEHDVPFITSYLIDKRIVPGVLTAVEGDLMKMHSKVPVIKAQSLIQEDDELIKIPKILSFDIETYAPPGTSPSPNQDPVVMVSFYSTDFKRTITWKRFDTEDTSIEFVDGEFELLNRFKKTIEEVKPDFLVGYTSDIFAFPYIKRRAEKYGMSFDLGLDHSIMSIGKNETQIKGIAHLDIYKFVARILNSKLETVTFRLEEVANELLGEARKGTIDGLAQVWENEPWRLAPYCEYNLNEARLIHKITEFVFPLLFEFVKFTNMQPFDVVRSGFSQFVDAFLMKESRFWNELIPPRPSAEQYAERRSHIRHVPSLFEPEQGIYNKVVAFDFASLYPSIIATHNISPGSLQCLCCIDMVPGMNIHFCTKNIGFFPKIMGSILDRRQRILKMLDDGIEKSSEQQKLLSARQEALRILSDSLYGHFGFASSRWYSPECANAISFYGKHYIDSVMDAVRNEGFDVLYADSDSVFLKSGSHSRDDTHHLLERINTSLPEKMQLMYEGYYPKAMFIAAKTGSRKKYALLSEQGFVRIKGFESSRRNYSLLAKETQEKVLYLILKEKKLKEALEYVEQVIHSVKEHKASLKSTTIFTQLQKDISEYETIAPHVAVAQRMQKMGFNVMPGSIIRYVVSRGEGSIAERSVLPNEVVEYDPLYYVEHQIIPSVDKIFEAAGVDFLKALEDKEQVTLKEFV